VPLSVVDDSAYNALKSIHILLAIVGFGAVFLNGLYASRARRAGGREGLAITETNFFVSDRVAQYLIYLVFLVGFALVGMSDKVYKFSQPWISVSIVLFLVGIGLVHGMVRPNEKRMIELQRAMAGAPVGAGAPPQAAEYDRLFRREAAVGMVLNAIVVTIVFLMVFKPT
jgi:uncharacterized membrane protein